MRRPLKLNHYDQLNEIKLNVNLLETHQEIDGFGMNINPAYWDNGSLRPVMELFHDDLEASLYRLDVYGKSNWIDPDNKYDKSVLNQETYRMVYTGKMFQDAWKMARYLNEKGIEPYLNASGIVPTWMCAEDGVTLQDYESFSEMMASMLHWARHEEKIQFRLFGPLNETDVGPPEGPRVNGEEYARCCEVLADTLDRWGLNDVKLVVAEQGSFNTDYTAPLLRSRKLLGRIAILGMHTYVDQRYNLIADQLAHYEDKSTRFWMTEYGDLDESGCIEWEVAWKSTERILTALQDGAQAGLVWDAYDNYHDHDEAWTLYGLLKRGRFQFSLKKRYYAAKQLYKFVKPGSMRVSAEASNNQDVMCLAVNHHVHGVSLVGMNLSNQPFLLKARMEGNLVNTLFKGYITNEALNCIPIGTFGLEGDTLQAYIPAWTIFTLSQSKVK